MAVQNPRPVIEAEDVVGEQVTMPVADAARRQPRLKQRAAALDVVADQSCQGRQVLRADQLGVGGQRVDVRHPTGQQGGRGAIGLDLRRASGGGMVGGKGAGAWWAARVRATARSASSTSWPPDSRVDIRRSDGIRSIRTSHSRTQPAPSETASTSRYGQDDELSTRPSVDHPLPDGPVEPHPVC
jgi:hypothetical protein